MRKLGQLLVEREWLTTHQLSQALNHQKLFGGRLGTCLLELNLLGEERLLKVLSEELGVPSVRADDLRQIDAETLALVPAKLACRSRLIPFEHTVTGLSVAMADVRDLALQDELAFVTSKRIRPFITSEVRILEALERHYYCEVELRFQRIWDRLNRARYLWQEEEKAPVETVARPIPSPREGSEPRLGSPSGAWSLEPPPPLAQTRAATSTPVANTPATAPASGGAPPGTGEPSTPRQPATPAAAPAPRPPRPTEVEVPEEFREAIAGTAAAGKGREPEAASTLPELEERFAAAAERDAIAEALLGFLRRRFARVLLFMVRGSEVAGWMGEGEGVDQARLLALELALDKPSFFLNLREGSPYCRGPLPAMDVHLHMAQIWGGTLPAESIMLPVRLRKRLVAVFYCDGGGGPLESIDMAELQQVALRTGHAFEQLLLRLKRRHREPSS